MACGELLLQRGVTAGRDSGKGTWPVLVHELHGACLNNCTAFIHLLCSYGASRIREDFDGRNAALVALEAGHPKLAAWLHRTRYWSPIHFLKYISPERTTTLLTYLLHRKKEVVLKGVLKGKEVLTSPSYHP